MSKGNFFARSRGQYTIFGFVILIFTLIFYSLDFTTKISELYKNFFCNEPIPFLIKNEWMFQESMKANSSDDITWEPLIQITNISEKTITIFNINILFESKHNNNDIWKLVPFREYPRSPCYVKVWEDTEATSWDIFGKDTLPPFKELELPIRINPGQKRYILVPLTYKITKNEKNISFSNTATLLRTVAWIVGAKINANGSYNCEFRKDLSVIISISNQGETINPFVNFLVSVEGCYLIFPVFGDKNEEK